MAASPPAHVTPDALRWARESIGYAIEDAATRIGVGAERLARHAERHADVVQRALALLTRDFDAPDGLGPGRAADFMLAVEQDRDVDAADAYGFVGDLLRAAWREGLSFSSIAGGPR